jgi:hypothetical protein
VVEEEVVVVVVVAVVVENLKVTFDLEMPQQKWSEKKRKTSTEWVVANTQATRATTTTKRKIRRTPQPALPAQRLRPRRP